MKTKTFNPAAVISAIFAVVFMNCQTPDGGGYQDQIPKEADFNISGTGAWLYDGNPKTVTITAKEGKTGGLITVKYDGDVAAPFELGIYAVTFDVAAAAGWNAAADLAAGTLEIAEQTANPQNPRTEDFDIGNLSQKVGKVTPVTITPKKGSSNGAITIFYNGGKELPTEYGSYTVTFNVAETVGWNAAIGLAAGKLTIDDVIINNISDLSGFLSAQPANNKTTPYHIAINIKDVNDFKSLRETLNGASNKFVNLNFSGSTITIIPDLAFNSGDSYYTGFPTLTGITIPDSVTSIGNNAFTKCTSLTSVSIPDSVTSIGNDVFTGCASLASVSIPDSVTSIGQRAFYECAGLTSVTIPGGVTGIESGTFANCGNLTSVSIPDSVISIGDMAFLECSSLASVAIPSSVTSIKEMAFQGCTSLAGVTIPVSVTSIESGTFANCKRLASITIPYNVTSIGEKAFYWCTSLASVTIIGRISPDKFSEKDVFPGDLRAKFYALNSTNGTTGTYTTANPGENAEWKRQ